MAKDKTFGARKPSLFSASRSISDEQQKESLMNIYRSQRFGEMGREQVRRAQLTDEERSREDERLLAESGASEVVGETPPSPLGVYGQQLVEGMARPIELGASYAAEALGAREAIDSAIGLPDPETLTQMRDAYQGAAYETYPDNAAGWAGRMAMGTAQQLPTMMGVGSVAGLGGVVSMYAGQAYNDAYVEATNKGLSDSAALETAMEAAAIEAGITLGFSMVPGLGGAEAMATGKAARQAVANETVRESIKNTAKAYFKDTSAELLEELSIEAANSYREASSGVNPDALDPDKLWERAVDTAAQTILMTGSLGAYNYASGKLADRATSSAQREEVDALNEDVRRRRDEILEAGSSRTEAGEDPTVVAMDVLAELADLAEDGRSAWRDIYGIEEEQSVTSEDLQPTYEDATGVDPEDQVSTQTETQAEPDAEVVAEQEAEDSEQTDYSFNSIDEYNEAVANPIGQNADGENIYETPDGTRFRLEGQGENEGKPVFQQPDVDDKSFDLVDPETNQKDEQDAEVESVDESVDQEEQDKNESRKFIGLEEAAQILGMSSEELVKLRADGGINGYRDGSSWIFKSEEVYRVAQERGVSPDPNATATEESKVKVDDIDFDEFMSEEGYRLRGGKYDKEGPLSPEEMSELFLKYEEGTFGGEGLSAEEKQKLVNAYFEYGETFENYRLDRKPTEESDATETSVEEEMETTTETVEEKAYRPRRSEVNLDEFMGDESYRFRSGFYEDINGENQDTPMPLERMKDLFDRYDQGGLKELTKAEQDEIITAFTEYGETWEEYYLESEETDAGAAEETEDQPDSAELDSAAAAYLEELARRAREGNEDADEDPSKDEDELRSSLYFGFHNSAQLDENGYNVGTFDFGTEENKRLYIDTIQKALDETKSLFEGGYSSEERNEQARKTGFTNFRKVIENSGIAVPVNVNMTWQKLLYSDGGASKLQDALNVFREEFLKKPESENETNDVIEEEGGIETNDVIDEEVADQQQDEIESQEAVLDPSDGKSFFTPEALESAKKETGYKSRTTIIDMDPADFLKLADEGISESKTDLVESVLSSGKQLSSVPSLSFKIDKEGNAVVTAHEGRHRARALIARGVKSMPVRFTSSTIRWDRQSDLKDFDRVADWPKALKGQGANSKNVLPFPVKDPIARDVPEQSTVRGRDVLTDSVAASALGVSRSDLNKLFAKNPESEFSVTDYTDVTGRSVVGRSADGTYYSRKLTTKESSLPNASKIGDFGFAESFPDSIKNLAGKSRLVHRDKNSISYEVPSLNNKDDDAYRESYLRVVEFLAKTGTDMLVRSGTLLAETRGAIEKLNAAVKSGSEAMFGLDYSLLDRVANYVMSNAREVISSKPRSEKPEAGTSPVYVGDQQLLLRDAEYVDEQTSLEQRNELARDIDKALSGVLASSLQMMSETALEKSTKDRSNEAEQLSRNFTKQLAGILQQDPPSPVVEAYTGEENIETGNVAETVQFNQDVLDDYIEGVFGKDAIAETKKAMNLNEDESDLLDEILDENYILEARDFIGEKFLLPAEQQIVRDFEAGGIEAVGPSESTESSRAIEDDYYEDTLIDYPEMKSFVDDWIAKGLPKRVVLDAVQDNYKGDIDPDYEGDPSASEMIKMSPSAKAIDSDLEEMLRNTKQPHIKSAARDMQKILQSRVKTGKGGSRKVKINSKRGKNAVAQFTIEQQRAMLVTSLMEIPAFDEVASADVLNRVATAATQSDLDSIYTSIDKSNDVLMYVSRNRFVTPSQLREEFAHDRDGGRSPADILIAYGYLRYGKGPEGSDVYYDPAMVLVDNLEAADKPKLASQIVSKYRLALRDRYDDLLGDGLTRDSYIDSLIDPVYWSTDPVSVMSVQEMSEYDRDNAHKPLPEQWNDGSDAEMQDFLQRSAEELIKEKAEAARKSKAAEEDLAELNSVTNSMLDLFERTRPDASMAQLKESKTLLDAFRKGIQSVVEKDRSADTQTAPSQYTYESVEEWAVDYMEWLKSDEGFSKLYEDTVEGLRSLGMVNSEDAAKADQQTNDAALDGITKGAKKKKPAPKKSAGKKKTTRQKADEQKEIAREKARKLKEAIRAGRNKPTVGVNLELMGMAIDVAVANIKAGALSFAAFVEEFADGDYSEMGDFGPYLEAAWRAIGMMAEDQKKDLGIEGADIKAPEKWQDVVADLDTKAEDKKPVDEEQDKTADENAESIERSSHGRPLGFSWFASGNSTSVTDLRTFTQTGRAVGVSLYTYNRGTNAAKLMSDDIANSLLLHMNEHKLPAFVDSGALSLAKNRELADRSVTYKKAIEEFENVMQQYERLAEKVEDKGLLNVVAPDVLVTTADGIVVADAVMTQEIQNYFRDRIEKLAKSGVRVIAPVHRYGDLSLIQTYANATDSLDFTLTNMVVGIPFYHAAWTNKEIVDFVTFQRENNTSSLKLHMLGGGGKRLKEIADLVREVDPTVVVQGDSSTEIRNRGYYDSKGERKVKGKLNPQLKAREALVEYYLQGYGIDSFKQLQEMLDAHDNQDRSKAGAVALSNLAARDAAQNIITTKKLSDNERDLRLIKLFRSQPNHDFDDDGTADAFRGVKKAEDAVRHLYEEYTNRELADELNSDREAANKGRGGRTDAGDASDATDRDADGTREPSGEGAAGEGGDSVGVRANDAEGSRGGGEQAGKSGDQSQRGSVNGSRPVGDGTRDTRGNHGATDSTRSNYELTPDKWDAIIGGSQKERFKRNLAAIEKVLELERTNEHPSQEDLDLLAGYTGWGAFGQELFQGSWQRPKPAEGWQEWDAWLRDYLGKETWQSMQDSITNAHFTAPPVVAKVWEAVVRLGFKGGHILEPSMGSGNFFGIMPRNIMKNSTLHGVELDSMTSRIAKILYPEANISNKGYEDLQTSDNFYDLAISNVPFGKNKPAQNRYKTDHSVHNFFFRRAMDHIKPGGLMVFITSTGTADGKTLAGTLRRQLQNEGTVVGMLRLPSNMMKEYAGTAAMMDLIIVRKNRSDEKKPDYGLKWWSERSESSTLSGGIGGTKWLQGKNNVVEELVPNILPKEFIGQSDKSSVEINRHWVDNPQDVIGTISFGPTTRGAPGMMVDASNLTDEQKLKQISEWVERLPENIFNTDVAEWSADSTKVEGEMRQNTILVNSEKKAYWRHYLGTKKNPKLNKDGSRAYEDVQLEGPEIGIYSGEQIVPLQQIAGWAKASIKNKSKLQERLNEVRHLAEIRKHYEDVLTLQSGDAETAEIKAARRKLNESYDSFVETYGQVAESNAIKVFKKAGDPLALALEVLSYKHAETGEWIKRGVFRDTTMVGTIKELKNASLGDAFANERNRSRILDYARIARSANMEEKEAIKELVEKGFIYKNEVNQYEPADTFLSGNVRKKYRALQAATDAGVKGLEKSIAAIEKIIPATIPYDQIDLKMGPHFVPTKYYKQFVSEKLGIDPKLVGIKLKHGKWVVELDPEVNVLDTALQWGVDYITNGTPAVPFSAFLRAAMNNATLKVYDPPVKTAGGIVLSPRQFNAEESARANEKLMLFRQTWEEWVWTDTGRANHLSNIYNEEYNSFVTPTFENVPLSFVGIITEKDGKPFALRKHQKQAVWRALLMGKGIFAHEVGTGKTLTMAALAMESKRFGYAKKPMLFAHNINAAQVADEIREAYPTAKVLYVDNLNPSIRDRTLAMIAADDWDVIVVPHSLTDRFLLKAETIRGIWEEDLRQLEDAAREAFKEDKSSRKGTMPDNLDNLTTDQIKEQIKSRTAKELVLERKSLIDEIKKAADLAKKNTVFFEDMGVDMVMVDEAHYYKKLPIATPQQLKGLNTKGSQRGKMLDLITTHVRQTNGGRGIYTFTGTPITNTLNEIFNQMKYIMEEEMHASKVGFWNSWFNMFAESVIEPEITTGGTWEAVERLRAFNNLPELRKMIGQYLDVVKASEVEEFVERPDKEGFVPEGEQPIGVPHKQTINVSVQPSVFQQMYSKALRARYEKSKSAKGEEYGELRSMLGDPYSQLVLQTEGNMMTLDPRLTDIQFNPEWKMPEIDPNDPSLKINRMIENAMPIYNKHPKATQMIFMQAGFSDDAERSTGEYDEEGNKITAKVKRFNLAKEIKRRLIEEGVKEEEIAVFSDESKSEKKKIIAKKMNAGKIRFALGSTDSMGVGVNAQQWLAALHHLDCPWMPGDIDQREGRAGRQGNRWNTFMNFRYVMEGDQDARRWQIALIKDAMIDMFMDFSFNMRSFDMSDIDLDENGGSDFDSSLSTATGDPRILLRNKLANELDRLLSKKELFQRNVDDQQRSARKKKDEVAGMKAQAELLSQMEEVANKNKPESLEAQEFTWSIGPKKGKSVSGSYTKVSEGTDSEVKNWKIDDIFKTFSNRSSEVVRTIQYELSKREGLQPNVTRAIKIGEMKGLGIYKLYTTRPDEASKDLVNVNIDWETYIGPANAESSLLSEDVQGSFAEKHFVTFNDTMNSFNAKVMNFGKYVTEVQNEIGRTNKLIKNAALAGKAGFPRQAKMDKVTEQLESLSEELQKYPKPSPAWFRLNAPSGSVVYLDGKRYQVKAHRGVADILVTDDEGNASVIPAKDVLDSPDGMPLYPELQEGYSGDIDVSADEESDVLQMDYAKGSLVTLDIGSFSTMFDDETLEKLGFDVKKPSSYRLTGVIDEQALKGDKTIKVLVTEGKYQGLSPDELMKKYGILPADTGFVVEVPPAMNVNYALDLILNEDNPVLDAMFTAYKQTRMTGEEIPGTRKVKGKKVQQDEGSEASQDPKVGADLNFDDRLDGFIQSMSRTDAMEYESLFTFDEKLSWLDRALGNELIEYDKKYTEGEIDRYERVARDQTEIDRIIDEVEDKVANLLQDGMESDFAPRQFARKKRKKKDKKGARGIANVGRGGSKRRGVDVPRKKKLGDSSDKPQLSAFQIIRRISSRWNLPIRTGLAQGKTAGFYTHVAHLTKDPKTGVMSHPNSPRSVRLARKHANNLAVVAHEIAHDLDNETKTSEKMPEKIATWIADYDYAKVRADQRVAVAEGFAEFMRAYMTLSRRDQNRIPKFQKVRKWFENEWAAEHPEQFARVKWTRGMFRSYTDQTVYQRLQSAIVSAIPESPVSKASRLVEDLKTAEGREFLYNEHVQGAWGAAYSRVKDQYYELHRLRQHIVAEEAKRNRELEKQGDPVQDSIYDETISSYEYATATFNTAAAQAEQAWQQGVALVTNDPSGRRRIVQGTDTLAKILAKMTDKQAQAAETYLVASHIVGMDSRPGASKTWPMTIEEAKAHVEKVSGTKEGKLFEELEEALNKFNNGLLFMLLDAGAISRDDFNNMIKAYSVDMETMDGSLYLPMWRDKGSLSNVLNRSSHVNLGKAVKYRSKTGSVAPVISPLQSTIQRAIEFYSTANSVQLQQIFLRELEAAEGTAKFAQRVRPMRGLLSKQRLIDILKQLEKNGVIEEDWMKLIAAAHEIREMMEVAAGLRSGRYGKTDFKEALDKRFLNAFMEQARAYFGRESGKYTNADVLDMLTNIPSGATVLMTFGPSIKKTMKDAENLVIFNKDGKQELVYLDPPMMRALQGGTIGTGAFMRAVAKPTKAYKLGATTWSTAFGMRQIPMDYITNFFQSRYQGIERLWAPLMYSSAFALSTLTGGNRDVSGNLARSLFRQYGGEIMHELTPNQKGARNLLAQSLKKKSFGLRSFASPIKGSLKWIQQMIAFSDVGPRYAEFIAYIREQGYKVNGLTGKITDASGIEVYPTRDEVLGAINAAREVTYNFNRMGTWTPAGEAFIPFINAKLEGVDKMARTLGNLALVGKSVITNDTATLSRAQKNQALYTATGSMFMIGIGYLWMMAHGDDDDEEQEKPIYQRGRGWSLNGEKGVQAFWIPNSREWAIMQNIGEIIAMTQLEAQGSKTAGVVSEKEEDMRYYLKEDWTDHIEPRSTQMKMVLESLKMTLGDPRTGFGIMDSGPYATAFQHLLNYDMFRGTYIEPQYMEEQNLPDSERYGAYTTETAKKIGKITGKFGISPLEVDFYLNNLSGGAASRSIKTSERVLLEQDYFNIKNMPFVSGIYTDRHMKRSVEDLYDMEDWLSRAYEEKRAGLDNESWTEKHDVYREDIQTAKKLIVELIKSGVDVSDDERVDIGRMQVGLAREALGRNEITSNVSAWNLRKDEMPESTTKENESGESFWNLLVQTARSKINSTTPSAVTKDFYANGLTAEQETERRAKVAEHAKEWLRKHANSPAVLEAYKKPATKAVRPKKKGFRPI